MISLIADEGVLKNIVEFDGNNFELWNFQIIAVINVYVIRDVVTGARVKLEDLITEYGKKWVKDNARAMYCISLAVEYSQLEYLVTCTLAHDMWKTLCMVHEPTSQTNKLFLIKSFHEYRMNPGEGVVLHIAKIQNLASQLKDIGETVSDLAVMSKILGSLPKKFHPFVTAWDSTLAKHQNIKNLKGCLINEERRLTEMEDTTAALPAMSTRGMKRDTRAREEDLKHGHSD